MDKKSIIISTLAEKHNLRDVRIKRTGKLYDVTVLDTVGHTQPDKIGTTITELVGKDNVNHVTCYNVRYEGVT
jgi:hypothetical protein